MKKVLIAAALGLLAAGCNTTEERIGGAAAGGLAGAAVAGPVGAAVGGAAGAIAGPTVSNTTERAVRRARR
jgi:outer membrane lipoprotein SlyB